MNKQKRMIYVWPENVEYYDSLPNKSDFINEMLKQFRLGDIKPTVNEPKKDERISFIQDSIAAMEKRDREARQRAS
jgi:hypothetical protein